MRKLQANERILQHFSKFPFSSFKAFKYLSMYLMHWETVYVRHKHDVLIILKCDRIVPKTVSFYLKSPALSKMD